MDKGAARKIRASPTTAYPAPRIKFTLPLLPPQPPIIGNALIHPLPGGRRRLAPCYSVLISQSSGNNKAATLGPCRTRTQGRNITPIPRAPSDPFTPVMIDTPEAINAQPVKYTKNRCPGIQGVTSVAIYAAYMKC